MLVSRKTLLMISMKSKSIDDVINENEIEMQSLVQPTNTVSVGYVEASWNKVLKCHQVYISYAVKEFFLEAFRPPPINLRGINGVQFKLRETVIWRGR